MNTVTVRFTDQDRQVLDSMRSAGAYATDEDVIKSALWGHAQHLLGRDLSHELFAVGPQQAPLFEKERA